MTITDFKIKIADLGSRLTAQHIDDIMSEAADDHSISDAETQELWKFAITKHVCSCCGIENAFRRATMNSSLCADCFWR